MRLWFFGSATIAVPTLQALSTHHTILGVITQPDRPQGRGRRTAPTPIKKAAHTLGLPVIERASPRDPELHQQTSCAAHDLWVVMAYGGILPAALLRIPPHGALNVHPSLLPKYRGAAPIPWAILNGEHETGISVFQMDAQVDHGPILLQERIPIVPDDTTETLTERVAQLAPTLLLKTLAQLEHGEIRPVPQDDRVATLAPRLIKADGWIDWTQRAEVIARRHRALAPWPGTMTSWRGYALKVLRLAVGHPDAAEPAAPPGTILAATPDGLLIQAGEGAIRILELQLAGGRAMPAGAFLLGHPMRPHDRVGDCREKS